MTARLSLGKGCVIASRGDRGIFPYLQGISPKIRFNGFFFLSVCLCQNRGNRLEKFG